VLPKAGITSPPFGEVTVTTLLGCIEKTALPVSAAAGYDVLYTRTKHCVLLTLFGTVHGIVTLDDEDDDEPSTFQVAPLSVL
jgi:hypothetical protein